MRLLHTSDWHVGRTFHGAPLLEHQVAVLDALVDVVQSAGVEVVVVAGDLYDRQLPSSDAVEVLERALVRLREAGARVVGISGNHDSSVRVGFAERIMTAGGVTIRGRLDAINRGVEIEADDGGPPVVVYPVPYLEPEIARHRLGVPDVRGHDALLRVALDRARADLAARGEGAVRSVAVVHAFVAGGATCDSERPLAVGGSGEVALGALDGFDYVALGHLHGRQVLADGRVRYSGSPLAYSFSERAHVKGAWLVDVAADASLAVEAVDLPVPRPLAVVRGTIEELLSSREHAFAEDAWVHAVLTDAVLPREAMARVRARFPYALALSHDPPRDRSEVSGGYAERIRGRTDVELVFDFVEHVTGRPPDDDEQADLLAAVAAVASEDRR